MTKQEKSNIRTGLLENFRDPTLSDDDCSRCLDRALSDWPEIFEPISFAESIPTREDKKLRWDGNYFEQAAEAVRLNFSELRLRHLLEVRSDLRRRKILGFAPITSKSKHTSTSHALRKENEMEESAVGLGRSLLDAAGKSLTLLQSELLVNLKDMSNTTADLKKTLELLTIESDALCQPYEVDAFNPAIAEDSACWNPSYFNSQTAYLRTNFSKKRFLHLLEVRDYLKNQGFHDFQTPKTKNKPSNFGSEARNNDISQEEQHIHLNEKNRPTTTIFFKLALLVGATLAAAVFSAIFFKNK